MLLFTKLGCCLGVRALKVLFLVTLPVTAFSPNFVLASDCPVEKFTVRDFERLKFSEALALSVIDTMEQSNQNQSGSSFDLGAVVKGAPVHLGLADMKSVSGFLRKNSDYRFSREQQLDFIRTNVSLVGERMYAECLKRRTSNFYVEIPASAYTEDEFAIKIKWTPSYPLDKTKAPAEIMVVNGKADGKKTATKIVEEKGAVKFLITRDDRSKSLQIIPTVDGKDNGEDTGILIPPIMNLSFKTVLRSWPGPNDEPFSGCPASVGGQSNCACSDDGGGMCGSDEKHFKRCITASESGMLLPSTLSIEANNRNGFYGGVADSSYSRVCADFGTYGVNYTGKGGFSMISNVKFTVREIVPIK